MKIFLFEPDNGIQTALSLVLEDECKAEVTCIGNEYDALAILRNYMFDAAIIDYYFETEITEKIIPLAKKSAKKVYLMTTKKKLNNQYRVNGVFFKPFKDIENILKEISNVLLT